MIELIQYTPTTPTVGTRPLMLVPPFINNTTSSTCSQENSFVAHAVSRGHTVFLVSWINAQPEHAALTWDDYIERGVVEAIHRVQAISRSDTINALGFCVGGTILATSLAALARAARSGRVADADDDAARLRRAGVLGVFIDPARSRGESRRWAAAA